MFDSMIASLREKSPLIHCITNYVTVSDVANMLLACGASPIMADDAAEVQEISGIASGLCLNLGTLHRSTVDSMLLAGRTAAERGIPIVLDPVGVGAAAQRAMAAQALLRELPIAVLRGNVSEVKAIAGVASSTRGVDACSADLVTPETLPELAAFVARLALALHCTVAMSGAIDVISDGRATYAVFNGHPMMPRITGSGCMLTGVVTAFAAANPGSAVQASTAAYAAMGLCGEIAHAALRPGQGTGAFRSNLIDAMSLLDDDALRQGMKVCIF